MKCHFRTIAAFLWIYPACASIVLWQDEFDNRNSMEPDSSFWSYDLGTGVNGWGNGELQNYTSENAEVGSGYLKILVKYDVNESQFTSARLNTEGKVQIRYGTIAARIQIPNVSDGLWPAFWTLGHDFSDVGWPHSGEIDIMEVGQGDALNQGVGNRRIISGAHWEHEDVYATYARNITLTKDLNLDFHVYRLEWTPFSLTTYVDDHRIWTMDINIADCPDCQEFHQPHFLVFNVAVGGGFTGTSGSDGSSFSSGPSCGCSSRSSGRSSGSSGDGCTRRPEDITAPLPATMLVDWVRVYQNGHSEVFQPIPTMHPTPNPTTHPSLQPTPKPPTIRPTLHPSLLKTSRPSIQVMRQLTTTPSLQPTDGPVASLTGQPTISPTTTNIILVTDTPTAIPTQARSSSAPVSEAPIVEQPRFATKQPSLRPHFNPTRFPSRFPTPSPSFRRTTKNPTLKPSPSPTSVATNSPTRFILDIEPVETTMHPTLRKSNPTPQPVEVSGKGMRGKGMTMSGKDGGMNGKQSMGVSGTSTQRGKSGKKGSSGNIGMDELSGKSKRRDSARDKKSMAGKSTKKGTISGTWWFWE